VPLARARPRKHLRSELVPAARHSDLRRQPGSGARSAVVAGTKRAAPAVCRPIAARPATSTTREKKKTRYSRGLSERGATGLEPATSGVTGRSWCLRAGRNGRGGNARGLPARAGLFDRRLAGIGGCQRELPATSVRDPCRMRRCLRLRQRRGSRRLLPSACLRSS
jgi:hypothetical protein